MEPTIIAQLEALFGTYGYMLVIVVCAIESSPFGWITPSNYVLAAAGFFSNGGSMNLTAVIISGFMGTWGMLIFSYFLGVKTGGSVVKLLKQEKNALRAERMLSAHGNAVLSTSLLSNVTRFWISYICGVQRVPLKRFLSFSFFAALSWVSLWVTVGYLLGAERASFESNLARLGFIGWLLPAVAFAVIYYYSRKDFKHEYSGD